MQQQFAGIGRSGNNYKRIEMKGRILILFCLVVGVSLCPSCNKGKKGFDPKDRTTVRMSNEDKDYAMEALKQSFSINVDSMFYSDNIKMSVLPPGSESLTQEQTEFIGIKMLQILAKNGVGGLNNVPGFALTASIGKASVKPTATAPQKFLAEYEIDYSVINTVTGDAYATATQKLKGVGASQEEAAANALSQISSDREITAMLHSASEKIIKWYEENLPVLKNQISQAEANNDYALALALIQSVPAQAREAYAYAESRKADIEGKFLRQIAGQEFIAMKEAILNSNNEPDAAVYAHYALIPSSASCYADATTALNKYEKDVEAKRAADSEQRKADLAAERQNQMELAKMENTRIMAKYQAQASEQAIRLYLSQNSSTRGFWSNLGARIIGAIDGTNWQFRVKNQPYTED